MSNDKDDPRWVDWSKTPLGEPVPGGDIPVTRCPVCGRNGVPHADWLGPVDAFHPARHWVHGGIPYDHDPYAACYEGARSEEKWRGMLAIREQHDQ